MKTPQSTWALLLAAAMLALAWPACANLDGFLYDPIPADRYTFAYADDVPADRRVPPELREELQLTASDGTVVHAVFARRPAPEAATAPTVLYHHGNADNIDYYWARVGFLWSLGANVLVYDYRGYGRTAGTPDEAGIYRDARAALAWLRSPGAAIDPSRLFQYGYSLGGGPACELGSTEGPFRGLVTESIFASVDALVTQASLVVPRSFVTRNHFDNRSKIRAAAASSALGVLLFHGTADDFVQIRNGELLDAELGTLPHTFVRVEGAVHNNVPRYDVYREQLRAFLAR